ncbi:hypothetical protein [Hoylesella saccharolytica]|jgi:hypothetical protein|uniref:hypothetical protein n=1 Tax=Hoylesella saccharolytica TaxID=633701 RepID=UPI000A84BF5B|nr:hypothetical protein [Hoylesella saccharolytica]
MEKETLEKLIERKEQEIKDLQELAELVGKEHLEKQIDLRLEDLLKLYKLRNG